MKPNEIIRNIIEENGLKYSFIASKLNINRTTLHQRLVQNNISINKLNEILKILKFKIIIVPENTEMKDEWFEVTTED